MGDEGLRGPCGKELSTLHIAYFQQCLLLDKRVMHRVLRLDGVEVNQ